MIGRFHTLDVQKHPQRLAFPLQTSGKYPAFVFPRGVLVDPRAEASIPGPPLSHCWPLGTHMTQPLELGVYSCAKARYAGVHTLCHSFRRADQMGQATLPEACPSLIDTIAITHQDTPPIANA